METTARQTCECVNGLWLHCEARLSARWHIFMWIFTTSALVGTTLKNKWFTCYPGNTPPPHPVVIPVMFIYSKGDAALQKCSRRIVYMNARVTQSSTALNVSYFNIYSKCTFSNTVFVLKQQRNRTYIVSHYSHSARAQKVLGMLISSPSHLHSSCITQSELTTS